MLNETFYLDGIDALSAGIYLQNPIEFSEPVPVVDKVSIPGRNGDLIFETGAYANRTGNAECFVLLDGNVEIAIREANKFLLSKRGYRKLETSDDPEHFWLARVVNGARIEQRLRTLAPFEISFDCKPQRFVKSGMELTSVFNSGVLFNHYGFDALPIIAVYGNGNGVLRINDDEVEIKSNDRGLIYIDCDTQNAYNSVGNQNNAINAPQFPVLKDGVNRISWRGDITKVEIEPRWWEL